MSRKHDGCVRGFVFRSEAWYASTANEPGTLDEIMVGMYHPEGGTTGEFKIRWVSVGGRWTPRLEVFDDAWDALQRFGDMLAWMATVDDEHVSPQSFARALRDLGIKDLTERVRPERISP